MTEGEDDILRTDAKCEAFRRACLDSIPLLPPIELRLPEDIRMMTIRAWARTLRDEKTGDSPGPLPLFTSRTHQDFSGERHRQMAYD